MKVIKNYLYNAGYQILLILAPLITTPYISRVIGANGSGINAYTNSWVTFFYLIGQMGITTYGNRQIAYCRDDLIERSRVFFGIELLQTFTVTIALVSYLVIVFLFSSTFKTYFLIQSLWIIAAAFDISWYFMGLEDFKKTVSRNAVVKLTTIALTFVIIKGPQDLGRYIFLLGFAQLAGNLTLWPYLRGSVKWVPMKEWKPFKHLYPSILLFIPTITIQIYVVVNRLMLGRMSTQTALGQFDYSDKIVKVVLAVVTATGTVMLPHIANKFAAGDVKGIRNSLYNMFDFVSALAIPIMFGLMAVSFKMAPWFLGHEYVATGKIIFLESPAILFIAWSNVAGNQYLVPINRVTEYTISVTVGAVINVIANLFLIHLWGANGAAVATVISEFAVTAVQLHCIRTTIARRRLFADTWRYLLSGLIMFFAVFRLNEIMNMNFVNLCLQVFVGIIVYGLGLLVFRAPIVKMALERLGKVKE
ncbi:oligosaccharide flippase family protein [[Lactobacillus] timonensis]|uniref:oligosaccharide flippase family protein n=1 Tax=[Lactobacillus] timonensis TaxID=1970790 RepID=UPI000C8588EA|nr:polysaccharide biosynthesis C-terminal domain-containing protein [[Lactobacillus] timonensis]